VCVHGVRSSLALRQPSLARGVPSSPLSLSLSLSLTHTPFHPHTLHSELSLSLSLSPYTCTGGTPWQDGKAKARAKKAKKKTDKAAAAAAGAAEGDKDGRGRAAAEADAALKAHLPKSYDEEFGLEAAARRAAVGAAAATPQPGAVGPHGHKFRPAPTVLHGYREVVTGKTAEERLDMRAALKGDKFCR